MATRKEIDSVALMVGASLEEELGYCPSPALCRELAMQVLVEAKALNRPLDPEQWVLAGYTRTLEQMHKESLDGQEG